MYEFAVEPTQIQSMPMSAFIFVGAAKGQRQVVAADCNPGISLLDRVARITTGPRVSVPAADPAAIGARILDRRRPATEPEFPRPARMTALDSMSWLQLTKIPRPTNETRPDDLRRQIFASLAGAYAELLGVATGRRNAGLLLPAGPLGCVACST